MQTPYTGITQFIYDLFYPLYETFWPTIPFGPLAWFFVLTFGPMVFILIGLVIRGRRAGGGSANVTEGIQKIIASTGDVSAGMAGAKKLKFIKNPSDALVFLRIEENAIQQALSATDYYAQQGEIDDSMKEKFTTTYQTRLDSVRAAMAKDEQLKEIVDTDTAIDKARSDYLRKMAAMSGTEIEDDTEAVGPTSVGMPSSADTQTPVATAPDAGVQAGGPPGGAAPNGAPSGGPPGGAAPGGGPPGGGPPGGGAPSGGPPGGAAPSGPPGGTAPGGDPPDSAAPGGPPSGGAPGGAPGADAPSGAPAAGGKSSLQSEMLAEMERLKALMSGD
ncbi:MAG: hypothetical protein KAQ65_01715 [Candidatus Thorarchaeota archaeon]|nr:hypothetical protein [Candidatus Thorarchaeota archaeon]